MNRLMYLAIFSVVSVAGLFAQSAPRELNEAIRSGHLEAVRGILAQGVGFGVPRGESYPPLHVAADQGQLDILNMLLAAGAPVDGRSRANRSSYDTALHQAVQRGDILIVEALLQAGAYVNAQDRFGLTAMHLAVDQGGLGFVSWLLDWSGNPDIQDLTGATPLYTAVKLGQGHIAIMLLGAGADVNLSNKYGDTPLHLAVRKGNAGLVQWIIEFGGNLNAQDINGETPLHLALRGEEIDWTIVEILVQAGGLIRQRGTQGESPLDVARSRGVDNVGQLWRIEEWVRPSGEVLEVEVQGPAPLTSIEPMGIDEMPVQREVLRSVDANVRHMLLRKRCRLCSESDENAPPCCESSRMAVEASM